MKQLLFERRQRPSQTHDANARINIQKYTNEQIHYLLQFHNEALVVKNLHVYQQKRIALINQIDERLQLVIDSVGQVNLYHLNSLLGNHLKLFNDVVRLVY